jgi:hypothetical protein
VSERELRRYMAAAGPSFYPVAAAENVRAWIQRDDRRREREAMGAYAANDDDAPREIARSRALWTPEQSAA